MSPAATAMRSSLLIKPQLAGVLRAQPPDPRAASLPPIPLRMCSVFGATALSMQAAAHASGKDAPVRTERALLIAQLQAWASESVPPGENRAEALRRLIRFLDSPGSCALDLAGLGLTTWPANFLHDLQALRGSPVYVFAQNNQLTDVVLHDAVVFADLSHNRLQAPPAYPESISSACLSGNEIGDGDIAALADHIQYAHLEDNRLTKVPKRLLQSTRCQVMYLGGNPIPEDEIAQAMRICQAPGYQGPKVYFSMTAPSGPPRPLHVAVADWQLKCELARWTEFNAEPGGQAFSEFLDRLRHSMGEQDAATQAPMQAALQALLDGMARDPALRVQCYAACGFDQRTGKEHAILAFQAMESALLTSQARLGDFDQNLPELIRRVHQLFDRAMLDDIAQTRIAGLRMVDPSLVRLAYQLSPEQEAALLTQKMSFYAVSGVTHQNLKDARTELQALSWDHFLDHLLNTNPALMNVFERLDQNGLHRMMQQQMFVAFETNSHEGDRMVKVRLASISSFHSLNPQEKTRLRTAVEAEVAQARRLAIQLPLIRNFLRTLKVDLKVLSPGS